MTDPGANGIWKIVPSSTPPYATTFYPLATPNAQPGAIVYGPDSNLWFVETAVSRIGKLNISGCSGGACSVSETQVSAGAGLSSIANGSDGALWFTETTADKIGRVTTNGVLTGEYPLAPIKAPVGLVLGEDNNFYIADQTGNQIGQFVPGTQAVKAYPVPTAAAAPYGITLGPDGEVYFTEQAGNKVGQFLYF